MISLRLFKFVGSHCPENYPADLSKTFKQNAIYLFKSLINQYITSVNFSIDLNLSFLRGQGLDANSGNTVGNEKLEIVLGQIEDASVRRSLSS